MGFWGCSKVREASLPQPRIRWPIITVTSVGYLRREAVWLGRIPVSFFWVALQTGTSYVDTGSSLENQGTVDVTPGYIYLATPEATANPQPARHSRVCTSSTTTFDNVLSKVHSGWLYEIYDGPYAGCCYSSDCENGKPGWIQRAVVPRRHGGNADSQHGRRLARHAQMCLGCIILSCRFVCEAPCYYVSCCDSPTCTRFVVLVTRSWLRTRVYYGLILQTPTGHKYPPMDRSALAMFRRIWVPTGRTFHQSSILSTLKLLPDVQVVHVFHLSISPVSLTRIKIVNNSILLGSDSVVRAMIPRKPGKYVSAWCFCTSRSRVCSTG